jgi:hypothetical protein
MAEREAAPWCVSRRSAGSGVRWWLASGNNNRQRRARETTATAGTEVRPLLAPVGTNSFPLVDNKVIKNSEIPEIPESVGMVCNVLFIVVRH